MSESQNMRQQYKTKRDQNMSLNHRDM